MHASHLSGLEPSIGGQSHSLPVTGLEPLLGGDRRFDPRIWIKLIDPRWTAGETLVAELSLAACALYIKALIRMLPAGSKFSEKLADGLVLGGKFTPQQRAMAARALGAIGTRIGKADSLVMLEPLIACLAPYEHEEVRIEAAQALGRLGDARAEEPLLENFAAGDWRFRLAAIRTLGSVGGERSLAFLMGLHQHSESVNESMAALEALGVLGGRSNPLVKRRIFDLLVNVFTRGDSLQRSAAARGLGFLGERDALDLLIQAVIHGRGDFQCAAVQALGILGDSQAVPSLIVVLTSGTYHARQDATRSLTQLGKAAVRPALAVLRHPDPDVRQAAIEVLGRVGASEARDAVVERLNDESPEVRRKAVAALGLIGGDGAIEELICALEDSDSAVRKEAIMMLSNFRDDRIVGALCLALWDADMTVRWFAAYGLGVLMDARSIDHLCHALEDKSENVSRAAADALAKIGDLALPALIGRIEVGGVAASRQALEIVKRIGSTQANAALEKLLPG